MSDVNPLSLSDDDFLNTAPPVVESEAIVEPSPTVDAGAASDTVDAGNSADSVDGGNADDKVKEPDPKPADSADNGANQDDPAASGAEGEAKQGEENTDKPGEVAGGQVEEKEKKELTPEEKAAAEAAAPKEEAPINFEESYNKIVGSIKADGKTFEIKSPEEAIKLMQQGVHYGRKMQELAGHRKTIMTLDANGITQDKLSFLIDLDRKNPEAIKKLIRESGIDPLEIDVSTESTYQASNHLVGDDEVNFRTVLEDLKSSTAGQETLMVINTTWDKSSKDELWKDPEIMRAIDEQKRSGIYDRIATEIERRKTLGLIPQTASFLTSYTQVGDQLAASGAFQDLVTADQNKEPTPPERKVLEVRTDAPKPAVKDNDRAAAAAASNSAPKQVSPLVNPLALSDEDFMKLPPPK